MDRRSLLVTSAVALFSVAALTDYRIASMEVEGILVLFAVLGVGSYLISGSLKNFYKIWLIKKSSNVKVHNAASNDKFVRIHGKAHKFKHMLHSPIGDKECFAYDYDIAKNTKNGAVKNHNAWWKSLDNDKEFVEFIVEDSSGKAHINSGEISLEYNTIRMISNLAEIPKTVAENKIRFAKKGLESKSSIINLERRIRFKEGTIQPNDRIFVIGKFHTKNGVLNVDSDERTYISDRSVDEEVKYLRKPAINSFIFGFVFVSFAVIGAVVTLL